MKKLVRFLMSLSFAGAIANESPRIQPDVVYGRKDGMALTFDVFHPAKANGAGIIFTQSGGWYSIWNEPRNLLPACGSRPAASTSPARAGISIRMAAV